MQLRFSKLIYVFTALLLSTAAVANPLLNPEIDEDEYFSETFTIFSDLDNGAYIYGQLGVSNIGPGNRRGICRILIVFPEGEAINQSIIVDQEDWSFNDGNDQVLQVKNCNLTSSVNNNSFQFKGKIKNQQIDILLHAKAKKHQMPHGRLLTKSGYYKSDILIPWAKAEVRYQLNAKTYSASGFGYADHSRSTLLPAKLAHQWVRFRALDDDNSRIILARQALKEQAFEGWMWWQNNKQPEIFRELTLVENMINNTLHWNIVISDQTNRYEIKTEKSLLRYAPMEEKGMLTKMLSYFIGNPVTYTYRSVLTMPDGKKIPGILEVARIDGE